MRSRFCVLTCAAGLLGLSTTSQANLLTNPSFESGTGTDADNWVLTPTAAVLTQADYPAGTGTSPYGSRFLTFNNSIDLLGGSATQDIASLDGTTLYELSFAYGAFGTSGTQTLQVTINATSVPLPAQTYVVTDPSTDFSTLWQRATYQFISTPENVPTGITFADIGLTLTADSDLLVDDVSLVAVPEPASIGVIALGLAAMGRRRRVTR